MKYVKKLEGERVYLSPMRVEDAETYVQWMNDMAVTDGLGCSNQVISVTGERDWVEKASTHSQFAIVRKSDDTLIGNCGFDPVDNVRQTGTVGIFIGAEENRSNGYGAEALKLLVSYGFDYLNLHNIMLSVFSFNERAIACYRKVGFREFGRRREAFYRAGERHDVVYMDVLRPEWYARYGK